MQKISLIAAITENHVIGNNQKLLWNLEKDMNFFVQKTKNHNVIMGRKNFFSIPKKFRPLKNRTNIIVTKNTNLKLSNCIIKNSIEEAIKFAMLSNDNEPFIIGGGEIYKYVILNDLVSKMYITRVKTFLKGDTYFPSINKNKWKEKLIFNQKIDKKHKYEFNVYQYTFRN
tara:strand:+ start:1750 stop:2262 length:513 start_codon:yes stop_codon:yes gene_type:complete